MDHMRDFNDIIGLEDKQGGRRRLENSFLQFTSFIGAIEMKVVSYKGMRWTWVNNRVGDGFIEERLDMVFGSTEWTVENEKTEIHHFLKHSYDHFMVLLDTHPGQPKTKTRFIFL